MLQTKVYSSLSCPTYYFDDDDGGDDYDDDDGHDNDISIWILILLVNLS